MDNPLSSDVTAPPWPKILSLLSLARKSRVLVVGQDDIKRKNRGKNTFLFLVAENSSAGIFRFVTSRVNQGRGFLFVVPASREDFFGTIGLHTTQIVALPQNHGLAQEIHRLLGGEGIDK